MSSCSSPSLSYAPLTTFIGSTGLKPRELGIKYKFLFFSQDRWQFRNVFRMPWQMGGAKLCWSTTLQSGGSGSGPRWRKGNYVWAWDIIYHSARVAWRRWACRRAVVGCGWCSAGAATELGHGLLGVAWFCCASHGGVVEGTTGSACSRSDGYASIRRRCWRRCYRSRCYPRNTLA
jgi:hypothetical protein